MTLRTYSEAKEEIVQFFGSSDDSAEIRSDKLKSLDTLSRLGERERSMRCELSERDTELARLKAGLESDSNMEETERCEELHSCCWEIGRVRTLQATVLNFSIEFDAQEKSCEISPVLFPDYSQRSDAFLSIFQEDLEGDPGIHSIILRVCVDERDNLYVATDSGNISVYDTHFNFLRQFKNELLGWPYAIAVGRQCLFVTEWNNSSLLKFSLEGDLLGRVPKLKCPSGLAVMENGLVAVTDDDIVHIFTHDLELVTSFGSVPRPCDVKLAKDNTLLVLGSRGKWMHWLSLDGHHGKNRAGCQSNMLFFAVDGFDNILLSDFSRGSIITFSQDMRQTAVLDNKGCRQPLENRSLVVRRDGIIVCVSQCDPCLNLF